jgi:hypothetical protein
MNARELVCAAFKTAKISNHKLRDSYFPTNESQDDKINVFTDELVKAGFKSTPGKLEYEVVYSKDNVQVLYSARFGIGYQAILRVNEK